LPARSILPWDHVAVATRMIVATSNVSEFAGVDGLKVEDWMA
jgi:hypothetical protein